MQLPQPSWWPLPAWWPVILAAPIAVATALAYRPGPGDYGTWNFASAASHESLLIAGPICAFAASLVGHTLARRGSVFDASSVGRGWRPVTRHIATLCASTLVGIAIGLAPLWWWTATTASWGSPDPWDLAITTAAVVGINAVAYGVGSVTRRISWCLVVAFITSALLIVPIAIDRAFAVVSPAHDWLTGPRFSVNPLVGLYFIIFVSLVVVVTYVLLDRDRSAVAALVGLVGVATMATFPQLWRPDLYVARNVPPPLCVGDGPQICVHPAHAPSIPAISETLRSTADATGATTVKKFLDEDAADVLQERAGLLLTRVRAEDTSDELQRVVIDATSGQRVCGIRYPNQPGPGRRQSDIARGLAANMSIAVGDREWAAQARNSGNDTSDFRAALALSKGELQALVTRTGDRMWNCDLKPTDLRS